MKENTNNSNAKIKMGLVLTLCLIVALVVDYFAAVAFDLLLLCLTLIASYEFSILIKKAGYPTIKNAAPVSAILIYLVFAAGYLLKLSALYIMLMELALLLVLYLCFYLLGVWVLRKRAQNDSFRLATNMSISSFAFFKANNTLSAVAYPSFILMFMYFVNHISEIGLSLTSKVEGVPYALFGLVLIFAVSCLTDTFAMLFGMLIGGKKIFPKISPKKTISGSIFGLVGGTLGAIVAFWAFRLACGGIFLTLEYWQFAIIGFVGAILVQLGDLFESYVKRRAGVKEAGEFFHSHGGVLDRFDSIIFCTPYIFVCLLMIVA